MTGLKQKTASDASKWIAAGYKTRALKNARERKTVVTHIKRGELLVDDNSPAVLNAGYVIDSTTMSHHGHDIVTLYKRTNDDWFRPSETIAYMGACECQRCAEGQGYHAYHLVLWSKGDVQRMFNVASKILVDALSLPTTFSRKPAL
jgi:hypothetical protein